MTKIGFAMGYNPALGVREMGELVRQARIAVTTWVFVSEARLNTGLRYREQMDLRWRNVDMLTGLASRDLDPKLFDPFPAETP
jgi:hypothetical protein